MLDFLNVIFSIKPFVPHGHCYLWKTGLVGLHVAADALTALAYYSIPIALFYFVRQRHDVPFKGIFFLFGVFILSCGTTHLLEIWTLWYPMYWLSGGVKAITAVVSLLTAIELVPLMPQALALPNPTELQRLNAQLQTSQSRFAAILENASDAIISINANQRITLFNRAAEQIFGYPATEALGQPLSLLLPERVVALHQHHVGNFKAAESNTRRMAERSEIFGCRKDGTEFPAEASISKLEVAGEKIFTAFLRDISEQRAALHKRKQTEQALQEQEAFLRAIGDNIPNGYLYQLMRDHDGRYRFTYVSAGIERVSGLKPEAVLADASLMFNLLLEEDLPYVIQQGEESAQNLSLFDVQVRERLPNGDIRWLRLCSAPRRLEDGRVIWDGIRLDINDLKQTAEHLRQSEERWHLAVSGSNDGIWDHNLQTNDHYLSPRCMEILGYEYDEIDTFDKWLQFIHPDDRDRLQATFQAHVEYRLPNYVCEYRMRCKNGSDKWLLARGQVLWDEQGNPLRAVGSLTDISDRKRVEEERKQAEVEQKAQQAFLRQVMDVVPNVIFVKDRDGRILSANQASAAMHGTTVEAMIGKQEPDFNPNFSMQQLEECLAINQQVMQTRQAQQILNQSVMNAMGELQWYQTVISPLINVEGQVIGIVGATTNVTALKRAEQALQQAKEAAEAANNAKSVFLANMSHELRTPLNVILGFAQAMARDPLLTAEQRENLQLIRRSGDHLLVLINDVLDLSKIEAGHATLDESTVDLLDLLQSLEQMFCERAAAKGLQLRLDLAPDLPQYITTDAIKLRQILINLLGNAIKFTPEGEVALQVRKIDEVGAQALSAHAQSSIYFEVKDTGVGIDPAELETIFHAFVQTQAGKISPEGTGLGLTISRKFVQMLGGEITVHSTLGHGSTFAFTLPLHLARSTDILIRASACRVTGVAPDQPTCRILVVDDQPENRKLLVNLFTQIGLEEIREASNGQEAITQWQQWQPHLIWMDIRMPILNGYEATQQIRATPGGQAPVIIALTGQSSRADRALALAAGCNDYLTKPFRQEVLFSKMAEHLGLQFLCAEEQLIVNSEELRNPRITLHAVDLSIMSPAWITELLRSAYLCDDSGIERLIQQVPAEQEFLIKGLYQLVQNFDFAQLIDLATLALAPAGAEITLKQ